MVIWIIIINFLRKWERFLCLVLFCFFNENLSCNTKIHEDEHNILDVKSAEFSKHLIASSVKNVYMGVRCLYICGAVIQDECDKCTNVLNCKCHNMPDYILRVCECAN